MIRYYFELKEEIKDCRKCPIVSEYMWLCSLQRDEDGRKTRFSDYKKQIEGCPLKQERVWIE